MKDYPLYQHPQINTLKELLTYCTENYKSKTYLDAPTDDGARRSIED